MSKTTTCNRLLAASYDQPLIEATGPQQNPGELSNWPMLKVAYRTDKDRIAMFGWSYGGYAALVAASRTPQIHQCVIAGAAVSDTLMQVSYYSDRVRGAQEIEQLNMWSDSINPIKEVSKVNVPILLIHGNVDQRVPPAHVRKYLDELEKYNKPYKYVELDGADHFSNTLFYNHQIELYTSMIDFLKNDCGPGGL